MNQLQRTILALLLLVCAGNALAGGQALCRVEVPVNMLCFAEQRLATIGPVEVTAGAEVRLPDVSVTPYIAAAWYAEAWFSILEVRSTFVVPDVTPNKGWSAALSFGFRW